MDLKVHYAIAASRGKGKGKRKKNILRDEKDDDSGIEWSGDNEIERASKHTFKSEAELFWIELD